MNRWVVKNLTNGYLCEDEDRIGGMGYDWTIDEFTIIFDNEESAKFNCSYGDMAEIRHDYNLDDSEKEMKNSKVCETCFGEGGITAENFGHVFSFECPDRGGTGKHEGKENEK